jgi:predicted NUDIX family phosphoesterase
MIPFIIQYKIKNNVARVHACVLYYKIIHIIYMCVCECDVLYLKIIKILYIHKIHTYIMLMYISQI